MLEIAKIKPGSLGALIGKRVYTFNAGNYTSTPNSTNDYTYTYDAVGNVLAIYNANSTGRGNELYYFTQDAFGNELTTSPFSGTAWFTARTAGITEHQAGKWIDPLTGLYFFHARMYDPVLGRFVSKDPERSYGGGIYAISESSPVSYPDPTGHCSGCGTMIIGNPTPGPVPTPTPIQTPNPPKPRPWPECANADGSGFSYGNWCGAGGDEWDDPFRLIWYIIHCAPIDELDRCCFAHDFCYFIHGINFDIPWDLLCSERTSLQKECDKDLCNCSIRSAWDGHNKYKTRLEELFCECPCTYHGDGGRCHWDGHEWYYVPLL